MRNIKPKITILKKHKSKIANKNNNATNVSNDDDNIYNDCNNNNHINSNNSENECLICLEVNNNNNEKTIKLNDLASCEKLCECNGWFHKSCLDTWFIIKFTCPICRNSIGSFNPQYQVNNFNNTQTYIQIIETRLTNNDLFIIFFSALFIYYFYFK
jgi:hypothetical protein